MIQLLCQPLRADRGYTGITVPLPLIVVGDRTSKSSDLIVGFGLPVSLHVSDLLEIPKIVTSTNLLGNLLSSMGALMEERLGLQTLAIPLELPTAPT